MNGETNNTVNSPFYTNSTTGHEYNIQIKQRYGDKYIFYANLTNNYNNVTSASVYSNLPSVNLAYCFNNCINLTNIQSGEMNVSNLSYTFRYCNRLTSLNGAANWNTSNVTSLAHTFEDCFNLTSLDGFANWDTSNVTTMYYTFYYCNRLISLEPLANWDTSNVTAMYGTFQNCSNLTSLEPLANWDVSNVTSMYEMFTNCRNVSTHGINSWRGASANCYYMFRYCNSLDDIEIHFNITCASYMFANRNTTLNVYASTTTNAYNALYRAMGNSTYNSNWHVYLYELEE